MVGKMSWKRGFQDQRMKGRAGLGKIAKLLLSFEDWAWSGSPKASERGISMDATCRKLSKLGSQRCPSCLWQTPAAWGLCMLPKLSVQIAWLYPGTHSSQREGI